MNIATTFIFVISSFFIPFDFLLRLKEKEADQTKMPLQLEVVEHATKMEMHTKYPRLTKQSITDFKKA